jgi:chromosomal replication initiator protein
MAVHSSGGGQPGGDAHGADDPAGIWSAVAARLQATLNDQAYSTWFGAAAPRGLDGDTLEVTVPNEFTRAWIEGHFASLVAAAARDARGAELGVRFTVGPEGPAGGGGDPASEPRTDGRPAAAAPSGREVRLNAKYTFDHFVIGSSNRFAHAAALAVAEAPAQSYNPLFLAGSTGLGKTHLLQAIAHYVLDEHAGMRARYVTCEAFTNDFIDALQDKRLEQFKARYRAYDVLLVDDIQFLAGKQRMQEEFFHTFNTLYESGSQIVLSSDRPPRDISPLESRLRSRFEWGLIADIQAPDLETRTATCCRRSPTASRRTSASSRVRSRASSRTPRSTACRSPSTSSATCCTTSSRRALGSSAWRRSRRWSQTTSGSAWPTCGPTGARRTSSSPARSRCTCAAT